MDENCHCSIISQQLGNVPEPDLAEKIKALADETNKHGFESSKAIGQLGIDNIENCVVGISSAAFLLKDGRVVRIEFQTKSRNLPNAVAEVNTPPQPSSAQPAVSAASAAARSASAKFRRVMLSTSSFRRGERGGVIIDRGRPLVPAASVPEELIAQAQVVLQGKSREVIVRELQRTSLNVNEAVNNLLSRDDDEDDGDDSAGEVVLPEELLSLLDPSSSHPLLEAADMYNDGFEYILGRESARKKSEKDKEKKAKEGGSSDSAKNQDRLDLEETVQPWAQTETGLPEGVERFTKIAATRSEVLAVSAAGQVYAWNWNEPNGELEPHSVAKRLVPEGDSVTMLSTSSMRVAIMTSSGKIASWLDHCTVGKRVCEATQVSPVSIPLSGDESVVQLVVSNQMAVALTSNGTFYWCGLYPYTERPKLWEKERAKTRKHVTFDIMNNADIKEGCEVRTKAHPIYAAGSVAVNLGLSPPMVGVLMESVWTLSEVCRFRVFDLAHFDTDLPTEKKDEDKKEEATVAGDEQSSRKRKATEDVFSPPSTAREDAWGVGDVVWIHEHQLQDTAVVKWVDGLYVVLEYLPSQGDMTFASSLSGNLTCQDMKVVFHPNKEPGTQRILRKDDLCLVTPRSKNARSPRVMQTELTRFQLSGTASRRVISVVVDSTGIRALVEKRGRLFVTRASITGKVLSEHLLPVYPPSINGNAIRTPTLINYGEDNLLMLLDGNGFCFPLVRDAAMGFREPMTLHLPPVHHFAICVHAAFEKQSSASVPRSATLLSICGPSKEASLARLPSLMQNVLYTDAEGVKQYLDHLQEIGDPDLIRAEVLSSRSDGCANILQAAVRLAVAKKNKDDADPGTTHGLRLSKEDTRSARDSERDLEQKWQRLLRSNRQESAAAASGREGEPVIKTAPAKEDAVRSPEESGSESTAAVSNEGVKMEEEPILKPSAPTFGVPVSNEKDRQKGAIATVLALVSHPTVVPLLPELLSHRDGTGLTPFQLAVNIRAYGAAVHLWEAIKKIWQSSKDVSQLQKMIHPTGSRPDDSPLFLLCYNDTCSFSWTGEDHINQDIFECRTCGLTGSLCCCTECAFTCHRNHDCKLKRTSPTAYCDCWEKGPCRALIAGNQEKREQLLRELLQHTELHEQVNNRGEHVLLFLARTLGRQKNEQANYRRKTHAAGTGDSGNTPEHDLDPPKFAKFALEACLNEWSVVKSAINYGMRQLDTNLPVFEDVICLKSQSGSTHLDKLVFSLFSKCGDTNVTLLVDTLVMAANVGKKSRDPYVDDTIARFVRSMLRVYLLAVTLSPTAAAAAIRGTALPTTTPNPSERRSGYQSMTLSGFFSIVRNENHSKEPKLNAVSNLIVRFRNALLRLAPYAAQQTAYAADALLAPVRVGILRPTTVLALTHTQDCIDVIEKFFNGENDLTTQLARAEEARDRPQRKRKISRRDTDRGEEDESRRDDSEEESDSEAEGPSSRRHNSQSGRDDTLADVEITDPSSMRNDVVSMVEDGDSEESSSDSSDDQEEDDDEEGHVLVDDDDEDNIDEEETEDDERDVTYGDQSEGDQEGNSTFLIGDGESQENENDVYSEADEGLSFRDDHDNTERNANEGEQAEETRQAADNTGAGEQEAANEDMDAEPAVQDDHDDNTRDAVHSEASSLDQVVESAEERIYRRMRDAADPLDGELSAVMDRMPAPSSTATNAGSTRSPNYTPYRTGGRQYAIRSRGSARRHRSSAGRNTGQDRSLSWTIRSANSHAENDAEEDSSTARARDRVPPEDRFDSAPYRAPPSTQNNSGNGTSPADKNRKNGKNDSATPNTQQTAIQLSSAFAFAVRLLCDLLLKLHGQKGRSEIALNWNHFTIQHVMGLVIPRLELSWSWMGVVLDRMESQLLLGNAIMASPIGEMRGRNNGRKKEKETTTGGAGAGSKKEKGVDESSSSNTRRETMEYLVSTLRAQSGEAGDDYPIVDVETIRMLVYVFDANLCYHEAIENCKELMIAEATKGVKSDAKEKELSADTVRGFFKRSNSMCFPGSVGSSSEAWDTLGANSSHVPLAEKSHLLVAEAEKETLFAPHHVAVTKKAYAQSCSDMGVEYVMNMSLTFPPEKAELVVRDEQREKRGSEGSEGMNMEDEEEDEEGQPPPEGMEGLTVASIRSHIRDTIRTPVNTALARWKNVLQYMAKECHQSLLDSYGGEPGSSHLLSTIARFPVRQTMFRKRMDKFRTTQSKDVSLEVHRDPAQLIRDTVFQLNQTFVRRVNAPKSRNDPANGHSTPMASSRVKVRFHDEPGEGSGVARSFYTALAEALQSQKKFPFEELGWEGSDDYLFGGPAGAPLSTPQHPYASRDRSSIGRIALIRDRGTNSAILSRKRPVKRSLLSIHAQHFSIKDVSEAERRLESGAYRSERASEDPTRERPVVAEAIYCKVHKLRPTAASRIAGMLVDLPVNTCIQMLNNQDLLSQYVEDAVSLMLQMGLPTDLALLTKDSEKNAQAVPSSGGPHPSSDEAPLFARTCRRGFFAPQPGKLSPIRISAFRNVGRILGLCLSQGELFPLKLARHVLKFILDRPVSWLDLQFYDMQVFDSLRQLMSDEHDDEFFSVLHLRFVTDMPSEDPNQPAQEVELKPGGRDIPVTKENVIEYVYRYVEMKMLGKENTKCLTALRQGVFDVLPADSLENLTAEDVRLMMCGTEQVCMATLQSLTTFSDESHSTAETIEKFKEWFWSVVEGLSTHEKQELIFFWTGAPSLPTSTEFIQPQPTVMIRPPGDNYLPTANTCISRLYVPLYSSKKLLRNKMQLAIKAKNFGFV